MSGLPPFLKVWDAYLAVPGLDPIDAAILSVIREQAEYASQTSKGRRTSEKFILARLHGSVSRKTLERRTAAMIKRGYLQRKQTPYGNAYTILLPSTRSDAGQSDASDDSLHSVNLTHGWRQSDASGGVNLTHETENRNREENREECKAPPAEPSTCSPGLSDLISELSARYNTKLLTAVRDGCALSRQSGEISDAAWLSALKSFKVYDVAIAESAMQVFVDDKADGDKNERYLVGVMRNMRDKGERPGPSRSRGMLPPAPASAFENETDDWDAPIVASTAAGGELDACDDYIERSRKEREQREKKRNEPPPPRGYRPVGKMEIVA